MAPMAPPALLNSHGGLATMYLGHTKAEPSGVSHMHTAAQPCVPARGAAQPSGTRVQVDKAPVRLWEARRLGGPRSAAPPSRSAAQPERPGQRFSPPSPGCGRPLGIDATRLG